jgi:4-hydroxybutyrate CoA-transferase
MLSLWYADGRDAPRTPPAGVLRAAGYTGQEECAITIGWTVERMDWVNEPTFRATTMLAGYGLNKGVAEGRIMTPPIRLSAVAYRIRSNPPDVAVVSGVRRGDKLVFAQTVGWADALARNAKQVIVELAEINPGGTATQTDNLLDGVDLGGPEIVGNIVGTVLRPASTGAAPAASRPADEIDLRIGRLVASILPDDPTLQFGPGGIGEGIVRSLTKPVGIWSGLVSDPMASLHDRELLRGNVVAAYAWGGDPILRLAAAGRLELRPATTVHEPAVLGEIPRFVGCNTALQLGLDGSVNVERVGSRTIAGVGGHTDFCEGATRSLGGMSIISVRSTAADGSSTIVPRVDVVSTARSSIGVVVTEHGIVDLRPLSDEQRRTALIGIAHPSHREWLDNNT